MGVHHPDGEIITIRWWPNRLAWLRATWCRGIDHGRFSIYAATGLDARYGSLFECVCRATFDTARQTRAVEELAETIQSYEPEVGSWNRRLHGAVFGCPLVIIRVRDESKEECLPPCDAPLQERADDKAYEGDNTQTILLNSSAVTDFKMAMI